MPLTKIGRYEIRTELGRGGMSTVFLAYDPNVDRQVALKMLPREFLHSTEFRERFNREAKIIAALEHPAIVPIYDFGDEEGQPYFVMRYMSGGSLADQLRDGPLAIDEALSILERIGSALDYAHSRGIIHRDLKPANILFDRFGKAYLGDFGIARLQETGATLTGTVFLGTPAYMSPEQVEAVGELTGRADIYALGVILFEVLTGHKPYHAETPAGLALKHLTAPVPSVLAARPDLPPDMEKVIDRAMAKKPEDRYPTAVELTSEVTYVVGGKALPGVGAGAPAGVAAGATIASAPTTVMPVDATAVSPPAGTLARPAGAAVATATGGAAAVPAPPARRIPVPVIVGGLVFLAIILVAAAVFLIGGNNGLFGGAAATDTPTAAATLEQTATTAPPAPTNTTAATETATLEPTATWTAQPSETVEASPTVAVTEPGGTPTLRPTNTVAPTQPRPTNTPVRILPTWTSAPPPPPTSPPPPPPTSPPPPPPTSPPPPPPTSPPPPPPPTIAPP